MDDSHDKGRAADGRAGDGWMRLLADGTVEWTTPRGHTATALPAARAKKGCQTAPAPSPAPRCDGAQPVAVWQGTGRHWFRAISDDDDAR